MEKKICPTTNKTCDKHRLQCNTTCFLISEQSQQLAKAAKAYALTNYSGTEESDYVMSVSENTFIRAVQSDFAKQYHYSNDSVEGLRSKFEDFYHKEDLNDILVEDKQDKIFDWFLPHLQKQQESDSVSFAEWTYTNHYVFYAGIKIWYSENSAGVLDLSNGKTTQELYQLFKSNE